MCIKMDLALNNQQWLMCHKTKLNQIKGIPLSLNYGLNSATTALLKDGSGIK